MILTVKNKKDLLIILRIMNERNIDEEIKYVVMELADNMIKANTKGVIKIDLDKKQIINEMEGDIFKWKELSMFLSASRFVYKNKDVWFPSLNKESSRGFLSIFFMDWELHSMKFQENNYCVVARKNERKKFISV